MLGQWNYFYCDHFPYIFQGIYSYLDRKKFAGLNRERRNFIVEARNFRLKKISSHWTDRGSTINRRNEFTRAKPMIELNVARRSLATRG